ncbi:hypothetical protein F2Q70_00021814 [Brassica cretica]|uniref:Uncharacterized protein n=1 Tax=Brassica cretica TaxID=69181 RepID=A0A8S9GN03_BRACR|nr:hypothetical protein F2Q70_00021814 [Brassica cretica]
MGSFSSRFQFFGPAQEELKLTIRVGVSTTAVTKLFEASWYMSHPMKKKKILRGRGDGEREVIKWNQAPTSENRSVRITGE